jgi:hypothetical protein
LKDINGDADSTGRRRRKGWAWRGVRCWELQSSWGGRREGWRRRRRRGHDEGLRRKRRQHWSRKRRG